MGTIPAPNIAELGGQIAQAPVNAMAEYSRVAQLDQQTKLQEQQTQAAQQENQIRQRQMQDADALTKAMTQYDPAKHTPDDIPRLIGQAGGSGQAQLSAQQNILARKTQLAQLDKDQLANLSAHHDAALGAITAAQDVPVDQLTQHMTDTASQLQQQGHLTAEEAQQLQQHAQSMPPEQFKPWLDIYKKGLMGEKEQITQAADAKKQAVAQQEADAKTAEANNKEWVHFPELGVALNTQTGEQKGITGGGAIMSPQMMESKYVTLAQKKAAGQPLSPDDAAFMKGFAQYKALVPTATFALQANGVQGAQPATTGDNGQPLAFDQQIRNMGAKGGVVKAIIEGRQDPPASFAQKTPYWQDIMQKVYAIDPEFNQQRAQLRKGYTVGQQSKEINAINTGMGHVGVLGDAIDALNNSDVRGLNAIANRLGLEVGNDNVTTFNTIVHRVGPEISKAYLGAGGSAGERGTDEKDFDAALGPKALKSNVAITAQLLRSKIGALENQWNQNKAPSMRSFSDQFITPEATKQLNKWNPQNGGTAGGGGHIIKIGDTRYQYKGSGATQDLANYTKLP